MDKKLMLIINPRSGKSKKKKFFSAIEQTVRNEGWNTDTFYTEYRGHASELARRAGEYERVVCVGGDGTLNEVINGMMTAQAAQAEQTGQTDTEKQSHTTLGYIPAGSTNDFAAGIGLPRSIGKSTKLASSDDISPIDVGSFIGDNGEVRYFSYVASFGMFTRVSYATDQKFKNMFGHMAYVFEGIRSIADLNNYKPFRLRIETEDSVIEQDYIFGAVTNSTSLGGLVKLDRDNVHVSDGLFELILIRKPKNFIALTDTVTQLLNHKYRPDRIVFSHTDHVKLISESPLDWTLDGEYAGSTCQAEINVKMNALDFVRREEIRKKPFFRKKTP